MQYNSASLSNLLLSLFRLGLFCACNEQHSHRAKRGTQRDTNAMHYADAEYTRTNDLSVIKLVLARKKWIVDCSWLDLMGSQQQGIVDFAELFSLLDLTISANVFALKYSAHRPRPRRGQCRVFERVFILYVHICESQCRKWQTLQ